MLMFTYIRWLTLVAACLVCPTFLANAQTAVPFELSGDLIILKVRVNRSRPLKFIFDTGASISVIDPQSAREALAVRPLL
jgi:hypothetical protein